jgi:hypothetical protein
VSNVLRATEWAIALYRFKVPGEAFPDKLILI